MGVHRKRDLQRLGAVEINRRIRAASPGRTAPVCYYLYSLQAVLLELPWKDLPTDLKTRLSKEADSA